MPITALKIAERMYLVTEFKKCSGWFLCNLSDKKALWCIKDVLSFVRKEVEKPLGPKRAVCQNHLDAK